MHGETMQALLFFGITPSQNPPCRHTGGHEKTGLAGQHAGMDLFKARQTKLA